MKRSHCQLQCNISSRWWSCYESHVTSTGFMALLLIFFTLWIIKQLWTLSCLLKILSCINVLVNIVYLTKLSLCYKMFTDNFFFGSHFHNTMAMYKNEMLSIAVAFQQNMSFVLVHCIIFIMWVHLRQQHVLVGGLYEQNWFFFSSLLSVAIFLLSPRLHFAHFLECLCALQMNCVEECHTFMTIWSVAHFYCRLGMS